MIENIVDCGGGYSRMVVRRLVEQEERNLRNSSFFTIERVTIT
jgi:hypothetical protein